MYAGRTEKIAFFSFFRKSGLDKYNSNTVENPPPPPPPINLPEIIL
jgi:hypothetical protein